MQMLAIAATSAVLLGLLQTASHVSAAECGAIRNNIDFQGNDLSTIANIATAEACCAQCSAVSACNAYTWSQWNGGTCFLKKQAPAKGSANAPAPDGSAYMRSGVTYKCPTLMADTDFANADIGSAPSETAEGCCGICRNTNGCTKFAWNSYNGGTCWLKNGNDICPIRAVGTQSSTAY